MFRRKTLFALGRLSLLIACAQAQPSGSVHMEQTFFNPEHPELIDSSYQNMAYYTSADFTARHPEPGTSTTVYWAIKSTGPDPIYPTFQIWHLIGGSSHLEQYGGYFHSWGEGDVIMIFAFQGEFVFRFGLVYNLPWEFTTEELWENMDAVGIYEQDTLDFTWDVPDAEIHISQACPRNWLPVIDGYIDSSGHPNHSDFKVTLKAFFTSQDPPQNYKMRWVLKNISWYTGACMNYYGRLPNGDSLACDLERGGWGAVDPPVWYLADLMILNQYNPNLTCWYDTTQHAFFGQTAGTITSGDTVSVVVSCYDFGAHGDIFVEAQEDSSSIFMNLTKHIETDSQYVNFTTIPRDEDNTYKDYLADYWEELMLADPHCPDTMTSILQISPIPDVDDYIHGVLPCELGDYLTVFEEYRGFYCKGVHTRTSPWEKDFFVYTNFDDSANFCTGIGYASQLGPGLCHLIDSTEMRNYYIPDPNQPLQLQDEIDKSINWYADRIDSHQNCASVIFLNDRFWELGRPTIGRTWVDTSLYHNTYYIFPKAIRLSRMYYIQIRVNDPVLSDPDSIEVPTDSLWQMYVSGHEIGHFVNMRHSNIDSSIMHTPIDSAYLFEPPSEYLPSDLEQFLVKPQTQP